VFGWGFLQLPSLNSPPELVESGNKSVRKDSLSSLRCRQPIPTEMQ